MIVEKIEFYNTPGQRLAGRIYHPGKQTGKGVIFSHGLFSTKDGYKITRLAQDIVSTGHSLLAFDFSFCGESPGSISDLSLLQEADDLAGAVEYFKLSGITSVHLMGSSFGALVSLVYASRRVPGIASLVLIAAPVDIQSLFLGDAGITDINSLPENGMTAIDGTPIKNAFFRELHTINMAGIIPRIAVPIIAIHGGRDAVVDPANLSLLEAYYGRPLKKVMIEDGDHNLTRDQDIEILRGAIVSWLEKF